MGTWAAGGGRGDHLGPESLSGDAVISQAQKLKSQGMTTCRRPHRKRVWIGSETEKENEKDGDVREREAVGVGGKPGEGQGWGNSQGIRLGSRAAFRGRRKTNPSDCGLAAEKAAPRHCAWSVTAAAPPLEWERGVLGIQESLSARRWLLRGAKPGRAGDPANARAPSAGSLPLEMWSPGRHRQHRRHDRHDRHHPGAC